MATPDARADEQDDHPNDAGAGDRPGGERGPAEPPREDPDAPGTSVDDPWAEEAVEPNEPA